MQHPTVATGIEICTTYKKHSIKSIKHLIDIFFGFIWGNENW